MLGMYIGADHLVLTQHDQRIIGTIQQDTNLIAPQLLISDNRGNKFGLVIAGCDGRWCRDQRTDLQAVLLCKFNVCANGDQRVKAGRFQIFDETGTGLVGFRDQQCAADGFLVTKAKIIV